MLLNCESHCCEQMVAGSSTKSCRQRKNCPPNNDLDLTNQAGRSCLNSPEQNDQNCDAECPLITQNQHNKGTKRRNDTVEGLPTVVLSSVSTNVASKQHQTNTDRGSLSVTPQTIPMVRAARCVGDNCSAYTSPPPQEHAQTSALMDTSGPKEAESAGNDGGDEGCESCYDLEDYDYDSILTKILNEKKLALSKSPEVINFFQQIPLFKDQRGANRKAERQTSQ